MAIRYGSHRFFPNTRTRIDPVRGTFFRRGEAEFFIAWRGKEPVGTICAAEDRAVNAQRGLHDCMFGFFECVPDYEVACLLFERAAEWARSRGLEALYGPFNLDYEDSYGVLIEGRDRPPVLLCGHTPPYYQEFVEQYGFSGARGDNLAYAIGLDRDSPQWQLAARLAERLRQHGNITIRGARLDAWEEELDTVLNLPQPSHSPPPRFHPLATRISARYPGALSIHRRPGIDPVC